MWEAEFGLALALSRERSERESMAAAGALVETTRLADLGDLVAELPVTPTLPAIARAKSRVSLSPQREGLLCAFAAASPRVRHWRPPVSYTHLTLPTKA